METTVSNMDTLQAILRASHYYKILSKNIYTYINTRWVYILIEASLTQLLH